MAARLPAPSHGEPVAARNHDARKQGFSSPEASWYRGENADYVRDSCYGEACLGRNSSNQTSSARSLTSIWRKSITAC